MNKINLNLGFSLIEIILYVSLLSLMMLGIFSTLISSIQLKNLAKTISDEDYKLLVSNFHE